MERVVCSWSGGKESALALAEIRTGSALAAAELMTMVSADHGRTSYHGVPAELIERQADALGVPVNLVPIPADCTGGAYVELIADVFDDYGDRGIERLVLGDVFLEDEEDYRETAMDRTRFRSYCPLLGTDTSELVDRLLEDGFEAITVCVTADLGREFLGRTVDEAFIADLPPGTDPAGEGGEYHTFVRDGPLFDHRVAVEPGEVVERTVGGESLLYCDLLPT